MAVQRVTNVIQRSDTRPACRVRVLHGDDAGLEIDMPQVGVVIGAGDGADVKLNDPAVSGRHVSIAPAEGGFTVRDLGSSNGTWLDGVSVREVTVPAGTTLRVGRSLVQLLPSEEPIAIEPSEATAFGQMVGESPVMRMVYALLERASRSDAPVLLLGESGTGKELAARAIHDEGSRAKGPFVVFDCGAASETLIESDLFGHMRGSFTGAHTDRPGAFALAHGGTLFLDEIGDLPLSLQPKLLRLLERGEVTPLGGRKPERYDVRIVAATHRDLWTEVGRGSFRGDLYYRLAVVEAELPALRHRLADLPTLIERFLAASGHEEVVGPGPALDRLSAYAWPGNVRELRNVVTRAVTLAEPGARFDEMPIVLRGGTEPAESVLVRADVPYHDAKAAILARFERDYLTDLLKRSGDNLSQAARIAGLERKYLYRVLERAGLSPTRGRSGESRSDEPGG